MKVRIILFFMAFVSIASGQLSSDIKNRLDSLNILAHDTRLTLDERASAFNRSCWNCVYQDYSLGLKISTEYQEFAATHQLIDREIAALHFLGYSQLMLGNIKGAEISHQKGLKLCLQSNNLRYAAEAYADLGNLRFTTGDLKSALAFHQKCLQLAEKNDFRVNETRSHINIGEIYEVQGLYKQSFESFKKAKSLAENNNFSGLYASIYEHLGDVNMNVDEQKMAFKYYRLSLNHATIIPNNNRKIRSLNKIGQLHQKGLQLDSALLYYQKALKIAQQDDAHLFIASTRTNIASILLDKGELKSALNEIQQALLDFENSLVKEGLEEALFVAGKIYFQVEDYPKSENHYKESHDLASKSNNISIQERAAFGLYHLYKKTGKSSLALKYYEEYEASRRNLRSKNEIKDILKMEIAANYKSRIIQDSLQQLRVLDKVNHDHIQSENKSKFNFYFLLGGAIILSLIIGFMIYALYQKRASTKQLNLKNETVTQALKDKEMLLKEVHHRVKNNMQVVSSLLYLKSENMPNEIAKNALIDSKKRIDSMQLSHQQMYQKGNYEQLNIIAYSSDIFQQLLYPIREEFDEFVVRGNEILLNVEQAQTLGYIIHELIVNSIKHAWTDHTKRKVSLSFEEVDHLIRINYQDNGVGLPPSFDIKLVQSFGMKLIASLVTRQLKGKIQCNSKNGTNILIEFKARNNTL